VDDRRRQPRRPHSHHAQITPPVTSHRRPTGPTIGGPSSFPPPARRPGSPRHRHRNAAQGSVKSLPAHQSAPPPETAETSPTPPKEIRPSHRRNIQVRPRVASDSGTEGALSRPGACRTRRDSGVQRDVHASPTASIAVSATLALITTGSIHHIASLLRAFPQIRTAANPYRNASARADTVLRAIWNVGAEP
jgi:hypothetical protein